MMFKKLALIFTVTKLEGLSTVHPIILKIVWYMQIEFSLGMVIATDDLLVLLKASY